MPQVFSQEAWGSGLKVFGQCTGTLGVVLEFGLQSMQRCMKYRGGLKSEVQQRCMRVSEW